MAFLETLESRLFLSVTPAQVADAVKVIKTEEAVVLADLHLLSKQGHADFAVITADVRRLKQTKAEASLGKATDAAGAALVSTLEKGQALGARLIGRDIVKLVAVEKALAKKPTNSTLIAEAGADSSTLTTDANTVLARLQAAGSPSTVDADLNAVASANSTDAKTGTDVGTAETDISTNLNNAGGAANTLYTTDITALENLFSA